MVPIPPDSAVPPREGVECLGQVEHLPNQTRYLAVHRGNPCVEVDDKKMEGKLKTLPERDEILPDINENLVVELYSK